MIKICSSEYFTTGGDTWKKPGVQKLARVGAEVWMVTRKGPNSGARPK